MFMPKHCLLVRGAGWAPLALEAFDAALVDAGVGDFNLIQVSSVFPPYCEFTDHPMAIRGTVVPTAYARMEHSEETIAAAIAVAVPKQVEMPGIIMEWHGIGDQHHAEKLVREMAHRAMQRRDMLYQEIKVISASATPRPGEVAAVFAGALLF